LGDARNHAAEVPGGTKCRAVHGTLKERRGMPGLLKACPEGNAG
jgi:hypothetical protein